MTLDRAIKFTPARVEVILRALRAGNTRYASAGLAGIEGDTLNRWVAKDAGFAAEVAKAEAEAEARMVERVVTAAVRDNTWTAAAWWLERRRPNDFARHDRVDVTWEIRREAARLAKTLDGVTAEELIADAERIVREASGADR